MQKKSWGPAQFFVLLRFCYIKITLQANVSVTIPQQKLFRLSASGATGMTLNI